MIGSRTESDDAGLAPDRAAEAEGEPGVMPGVRRRVLMEYVGRTALVVTGPYTGEQYRFDQPGSRLPVDLRDQQSLSGVPVLRMVSPPAMAA